MLEIDTIQNMSVVVQAEAGARSDGCSRHSFRLARRLGHATTLGHELVFGSRLWEGSRNLFPRSARGELFADLARASGTAAPILFRHKLPFALLFTPAFRRHVASGAIFFAPKQTSCLGLVTTPLVAASKRSSLRHREALRT